MTQTLQRRPSRPSARPSAPRTPKAKAPKIEKPVELYFSRVLPNGAREFLSPSRSCPDTKHEVTKWPSGAITCTCDGYHYYHDCAHCKALAEMEARRNEKSATEYIEESRDNLKAMRRIERQILELRRELALRAKREEELDSLIDEALASEVVD